MQETNFDFVIVKQNKKKTLKNKEFSESAAVKATAEREQQSTKE